MSAEVIPSFLPLLSSNKALMTAPFVRVGRTPSVMVQTNLSGMELPTSLKEPLRQSGITEERCVVSVASTGVKAASHHG